MSPCLHSWPRPCLAKSGAGGLAKSGAGGLHRSFASCIDLARKGERGQIKCYNPDGLIAPGRSLHRGAEWRFLGKVVRSTRALSGGC